VSQVLVSVVDGISSIGKVRLFHSERFIRLIGLFLPGLIIVMSSEGIESSELDPSCAHLIVFLLTEEATNISTSKRNAEHVHVHDAGN
jgi:hypothetical protein